MIIVLNACRFKIRTTVCLDVDHDFRDLRLANMFSRDLYEITLYVTNISFFLQETRLLDYEDIFNNLCKIMFTYF